MKKLSLFFLGFLTLVLLGACSPKRLPLMPDSDASARWQKFTRSSALPGSYDILAGSLRFGPINDTRRVTYLLWSGLPAEAGLKPAGLTTMESDTDSRVIRLEVNAGVGTNIAKAIFENGNMLIILPQDHHAYAGVENEKNLRSLLGLPLPFRMAGLNDFLAGRYLSALAYPVPENAASAENGNIVYSYKNRDQKGEIELNSDALPVRWSVSGQWTLNVSYDEASLPYRLDGKMTGTDGPLRMVLLVKERRAADSLPPSSLSLEIPEEYPVYSLDR